MKMDRLLNSSCSMSDHYIVAYPNPAALGSDKWKICRFVRKRFYYGHGSSVEGGEGGDSKRQTKNIEIS